jgi:hypothetical protein
LWASQRDVHRFVGRTFADGATAVAPIFGDDRRDLARILDLIPTTAKIRFDNQEYLCSFASVNRNFAVVTAPEQAQSLAGLSRKV